MTDPVPPAAPAPKSPPPRKGDAAHFQWSGADDPPAPPPLPEPEWFPDEERDE